MANYDSYSKDHLKKICFECREMLDVGLFRVREKKSGRGKGKYINNTCRKCEKDDVDEYRMTDIGIAAEIVRHKKSLCKKQGLPFDLDRNWVLCRLNEIGWKCELTNLPMVRIKKAEKSYTPWNSISVDRVVHGGGYTKDNIRFVLNQINTFRGRNSDDTMYHIAEALVRNQP